MMANNGPKLSKILMIYPPFCEFHFGGFMKKWGIPLFSPFSPFLRISFWGFFRANLADFSRKDLFLGTFWVIFPYFGPIPPISPTFWGIRILFYSMCIIIYPLFFLYSPSNIFLIVAQKYIINRIRWKWGVKQ